MRLRHYEKNHAYNCPKCGEHTLYIHDHKVAECTSCKFTGVLKRNVMKHSDELKMRIDGISYRIEAITDDGKLCVVVNNEVVCIDKQSH